MKEIKAFIHRNRIADVLHMLKNSDLCKGHCHLSINDVAGTLKALDNKEKNYSIEFGEGVITEVKLEIICEDEFVDDMVSLISNNAKTGQAISGWVYVCDIDKTVKIKM